MKSLVFKSLLVAAIAVLSVQASARYSDDLRDDKTEADSKDCKPCQAALANRVLTRPGKKTKKIQQMADALLTDGQGAPPIPGSSETGK